MGLLGQCSTGIIYLSLIKIKILAFRREKKLCAEYDLCCVRLLRYLMSHRGGQLIRRAVRISMGGSSLCPSWGCLWISLTTSMPSVTCPYTAKPCPSGFLLPP